MIDPGTVAAVGGKLLGGLLGNNSDKKRAKTERKWALEDQAQFFVRNRKAAEDAGFNPLSAMGMFQGTAPTSAAGGNYMGNAIADAGLLVADNLQLQKEEKGRIAQLEAANQKLQDRIIDMTIRPKVGGIYAANHVTPGIKAALGAKNERSGKAGEIGSLDPQDYTLGGAIPIPDGTIDRGSGLFLGGAHLEGAPGWSPASVIEENYGDSELISTLYGIAKVGADTWHNGKRLYRRVRDAHPLPPQKDKPWIKAWLQDPMPLPNW